MFNIHFELQILALRASVIANQSCMVNFPISHNEYLHWNVSLS